nr:immunoglobulin light chain junction region [Macaca mulatta]MPN89428.1 immunoglobulin light chain junction region [Macaca mulatta]
CQQYDKFPF